MDKCSFCGKSEKFGIRLVRGPEVAICEESVELATEVIEGMPEPERPAGRVVFRSFVSARRVEEPSAEQGRSRGDSS